MVQDILIKEYKIAISIFSPVWKCSEQTYVHLLPGAQALPSELTRFIACTHFSHLSLSLSLLGKIWNDKGLPIILWFVHRTHEHDFGILASNEQQQPNPSACACATRLYKNWRL